MQEKIAELKRIITSAAGENTVALLWITSITPDEEQEHIKDIYFGKLCGFMQALYEAEKIDGSTHHRAQQVAEEIRWNEV